MRLPMENPLEEAKIRLRLARESVGSISAGASWSVLPQIKRLRACVKEAGCTLEDIGTSEEELQALTGN